MNKFKLMLALLAAPSMVLASCGDNPAVVDGKVTKVSIVCKTKEVAVGKSISASANVTTEGDAAKTVTWSSSNESVATVDSNGKITGKKAGSVKITATSTVDKTKSDSVDITVVNADWSAADKALMEDCLGEVLPYVEGGFAWTDEYYDTYGCLTAEANGDKAKATHDAFVAAGFTDEGSVYDEDYDVTEYYSSKDSAVSSDYYLLVDIYYYDSITTIDVYLQMVEYDEWPTEVIASAMTECGFQGTVPAYDAGDDAGYTASVQQLTDGSACVYITVTDYDEESDLSADDYVYSLDLANYNISYEDYVYYVSPVDKAFTMIVYDLQSDYYYGFEIIVCDYIADESVVINEKYDMVAVGGTLDLSLTKGIDVPAEAVISYSSSNDAVATVSDAGVVSGVAKGNVTISVLVDGVVADESVFYVVDAIPTEFSAEQKAEFDNIHGTLGDYIPFNVYFDSVEFVAADLAVYVESSYYSQALEAYLATLEDDGWVNVIDEAYGAGMSSLLYAFGYPFTFEKEIVIAGESFFVGMQVYALNSDDDGDYFDYEGYLNAIVYDDYLYSYADAVAAINAEIAGKGVSTVAEFPDDIPGSHYSVSYSEDYNSVDFIAYDAEGATMQGIVDALNNKGWDAEIVHVDEYVDDYGETVDAYDVISALSSDGVLEIEGYVEDDTVALYIYLPAVISDDVVFGELELENEAVLSECEFVTASGYKIEFDIGKGQAEPKYYDNGEQARCYASNTITITAPEGQSLPSFTIYGTANKGGTLSANVGTLSTIDGGYSWSGDANQVVLTVSSSGQYRITEIDLSAK